MHNARSDHSPFVSPLRAGFTLVELSIVLVIISLLIGGVLGGQELIKSSRLLSTVKDAQEIRDAVGIFQQKYKDLPGDMSDASGFWSGCVDAGGNPCNGNGDKMIVGSERYRAWQHLTLAGLTPGNYSGALTPVTPGKNVFPARYDGFYYIMTWDSTFGKSSNYLDILGPNEGTASVMHAADAKAVDQKVDDGIAFKGSVLGYQDIDNATRGCPRGSNTNPSDYIVSRSQPECRLRFNWIGTQSAN